MGCSIGCQRAGGKGPAARAAGFNGDLAQPRSPYYGRPPASALPATRRRRLHVLAAISSCRLAWLRSALAPPRSPPRTRTAALPRRPQAAPASSGTRKGWFGGEESSNLSKWYGPERALFLPGGLLDRNDLPDYLDGTLAGDYGCAFAFDGV